MMTLREFKALLTQHADKSFQLRLPDGGGVPVSFHITEVGRVTKTFLDCGCTHRQSDTCQLQAWVGEDADHRIAMGKLLGIFRKAAFLLPDENIPVEIEYGADVISQYPISNTEISESTVILHLSTKHTDCLAKELCGLPNSATTNAIGCCAPGCC
jgi:hypothetical protein